MLIWMCALRCEAKPLIDFYRLHKLSAHPQFDHYSNNNIGCVVTGIGEKNMAAATAWAGVKYQHQHPLCWINLGIAGHKQLPVGSMLVASHIRSNSSLKEFKTVPGFEHHIPVHMLISVHEAQLRYPESEACDMEAYAFMQSATQYSPPNQCQVIKIISDNEGSPPHRDKARISSLIASNMQAIAEFAAQLHEHSTG